MAYINCLILQYNLLWVLFAVVCLFIRSSFSQSFTNHNRLPSSFNQPIGGDIRFRNQPIEWPIDDEDFRTGGGGIPLRSLDPFAPSAIAGSGLGPFADYTTRLPPLPAKTTATLPPTWPPFNPTTQPTKALAGIGAGGLQRTPPGQLGGDLFSGPSDYGRINPGPDQFNQFGGSGAGDFDPLSRGGSMPPDDKERDYGIVRNYFTTTTPSPIESTTSIDSWLSFDSLCSPETRSILVGDADFVARMHRKLAAATSANYEGVRVMVDCNGLTGFARAVCYESRYGGRSCECVDPATGQPNYLSFPSCTALDVVPSTTTMKVPDFAYERTHPLAGVEEQTETSVSSFVTNEDETTEVSHTNGENDDDGFVMNFDTIMQVFLSQPGVLAGVIGGCVMGLTLAMLLIVLVVYRMRKKDEGSYALAPTGAYGAEREFGASRGSSKAKRGRRRNSRRDGKSSALRAYDTSQEFYA